MMDWTPREDKQLMKLRYQNSIPKIAKILNRSYEQVRYRINYLVEIQKTGFEIENILAEFPELLPSQRQQAINIAQYEPGSAWRYCDAIRQSKTKYQEWNPPRIRERRTAK
jgi:hypothetical protein